MSSKVKNKILILGSGIYGRPFTEHGNCILSSDRESPSAADWENVKLVVFTGGHDVDPSLYKEDSHKTTHSSLYRDKRERVFFDLCKLRKIPMVGICRGSQFLTVMNGGRLAQNVYNHANGNHSIVTHEGKTLEVTSTHHQMMFPRGKYKLLAWANGLSPKYETGNGIITPKEGQKFTEAEAVFFPDTKCLAVQFHPEYMNSDTKGYLYFQELIKEYSL